MTAKIPDEAVDALARSKYERFDSHFSMPGGLSWPEYLVDDPQGAEFYLNDALDDLAAVLPALTAGVGERIAQAIEARCRHTALIGIEVCERCAEAARIAREVTA